MTTAWELIQTVERAGGQFVVNGDLLGISPAIAVQTVLEEVRRNKAEIINLLNTRSATPDDSVPDGCWGEWLLDNCAHIDDWGSGTGELYLSRARWCADHGRPVPASRRAFVAALQAEGFQVTIDGLVYGLILKVDLEAQT
jgi:hypothetical protein